MEPTQAWQQWTLIEHSCVSIFCILCSHNKANPWNKSKVHSFYLLAGSEHTSSCSHKTLKPISLYPCITSCMDFRAEDGRFLSWGFFLSAVVGSAGLFSVSSERKHMQHWKLGNLQQYPAWAGCTGYGCACSHPVWLSPGNLSPPVWGKVRWKPQHSVRLDVAAFSAPAQTTPAGRQCICCL